jgi:lipopolysaccharide export system protein LptC
MIARGPDLTTAPLSTAERMEAWRRRSQRVFFLRRWLPRAGIALVSFTVLWMLVRAVIALVVASDFKTGEVHMINPKFLGRDENGRPYSVTAKDAVRDAAHPDRVRLTEPVLTLETPGASPTLMHARLGNLDQTAHRLVLVGDVKVDDGKGAHFHSERAVIDTEGGAVRGDSAVQGVGPLGRINASSYAISPGGDHIVFSGGVQSRLYLKSQPPAGSEPEKR